MAVPRLGRRTALTLPLLPPPQKNRSPPSDSSPDTPIPGRHLEPLQHLARFGIDSPQIALVAFPGAVPELAVDPGHPGDEAVGLDGAKNRPGLRIDLVDLPAPMLPHPERPFGPGEPGVAAAAGRGDRREHIGRSSDRSCGCDPRRSDTDARRRTPSRHARRHRSSAATFPLAGSKALQLVSGANQTC